MSDDLETTEPLRPQRSLRKRLTLKDELAMAVLPTGTVLGVLVLLELFSQQRILFASLASSAFLIYLDPSHATNTTRTLAASHLLAAGLGFVALLVLGPGYAAAAVAMVAAILAMILLDIMHPPAISTSLVFAFRTSADTNIGLFALAVGMTAVLVLMQRAATWMLARQER